MAFALGKRTLEAHFERFAGVRRKVEVPYRAFDATARKEAAVHVASALTRCHKNVLRSVLWRSGQREGHVTISPLLCYFASPGSDHHVLSTAQLVGAGGGHARRGQIVLP